MLFDGKTRYNPSLTVAENAKKNGVSEATIRLYIKNNSIDRRFDRKINIIEDCKKYLKKHPKATREEICKKTGHSLSTIRKYWEYISTEKPLTDFDKEKSKRRRLRQDNNFYATHPSVTQDILRKEKFHNKVLEPFCGTGSMAEVIKENGYEVEAYDIIDRGYGKVGDFYEVDFPKGEYDIISNPPYDTNLPELIVRCLSIAKNKVALLLPLDYLSGKQRIQKVYSTKPPRTVYVYEDRIIVGLNADFKQNLGNKINYAWYVWEKGFKGTPELKWIANEMPSEQGESKYDSVTILNGIEFKPNEEFEIPLRDCIQFHSKALPENQILSNHYECIITFRGVEFYGLEQLYAGLTYSNSPTILRRIMNATSGTQAKSICHKEYEYRRDRDFREKRYRIIALCHLYKYLSVKEYRDRLQETYPQTLVETPNGKDYHFGMVQNLQTNVFHGNNCSGRTTMIVRDTMRQLEIEALNKKKEELGRELSEEERETTLNVLYGSIRAKYDTDAQVLKDSKRLIDFIQREEIPVIRKKRPQPFKKPVKDTVSKCLILDFDNTLFDTSVDYEFRRAKGEKDWDKIYSLIPQYRLYDGWSEVFDWVKENHIKVGIISSARRELIERTLDFFHIHFDCIIGYRQFYDKPNPILVNFALSELNVLEENVISIGDNTEDEIMSRAAKLRFIGAVWDSRHKEELESKCQTISNPREIMRLFGTE